MSVTKMTFCALGRGRGRGKGRGRGRGRGKGRGRGSGRGRGRGRNEVGLDAKERRKQGENARLGAYGAGGLALTTEGTFGLVAPT